MKNRCIYRILLAILAFNTMVKAQNTITTASGNATGLSGSISYSIGQIDYTNSVEPGFGSINLGVQQPLEFFVLGTDKFPEISLIFSVYPNPTSSYVNLKITNYPFNNLQFQLFDINGRLISNEKISESETKISLENLSSAIYLLNVNDGNKMLKTFKIIKT